jgi:hypothetical protein
MKKNMLTERALWRQSYYCRMPYGFQKTVAISIGN